MSDLLQKWERTERNRKIGALRRAITKTLGPGAMSLDRRAAIETAERIAETLRTNANLIDRIDASRIDVIDDGGLAWFSTNNNRGDLREFALEDAKAAR